MTLICKPLNFSYWVFTILVKLCSTQGTNTLYIQARDFHEKMPATAEFRLRPKRGVALQPRDIYSDRQTFYAILQIDLYVINAICQTHDQSKGGDTRELQSRMVPSLITGSSQLKDPLKGSRCARRSQRRPWKLGLRPGSNAELMGRTCPNTLSQYEKRSASESIKNGSAVLFAQPGEEFHLFSNGFDSDTELQPRPQGAFPRLQRQGKQGKAPLGRG